MTSYKIDALPLRISASPSYVFHSSTRKAGFAKMLRHGNGNKYSQAPLPSQTFPSSKSQTFQASKSTADISLQSDRTNISGPIQLEPALITSKWNFGWQVPTLILASYAAGMNSHEKIMILFLTINFSSCDCTCPPHPIQIHRWKASRWAKPSRTPILHHNSFNHYGQHFRLRSESGLVCGVCPVSLASLSSPNDESFYY
jgi:hypothetical protein